MHVEDFASTTSFSVNHALGQQYVIVQVYDTNDVQVIPSSVTLTDANNVALTFAVATLGKVVIIGIPGVPQS